MSKKIASIRDVQPQRRNANRHSPRGMGALERSIQEDGWIGAITVAADGETFDGSARIETAGATAFDEVEPIVVRSRGDRPIIHVREDIPSANDERALRLSIAANRVAELNLSWSPAVLAELGETVDLSGLFHPDEMAALLAQVQPEIEIGNGGDDFDATPQEGPTRTVLGDLWLIRSPDGREHRLIVGDCTDPLVIAELMRDDRADMVWIDPPYGVDYEGGRNPESNTPREKLAGDTSGALYAACMDATTPYCKSTAPWYIWFAGSIGEPVYAAAARHGYKVRAMLVWNKLDAHYGNFMAQYMQKHEPCLYCVKDTPPWHGPTNEVTVWDVKQPTVNEDHPTQKPLELAERAIRNSSVRGAIVCDWFGGSGTALIAAHRLGRVARMCEIEPKYADVVLRRAEAEHLTCERVSE